MGQGLSERCALLRVTGFGRAMLLGTTPRGTFAQSAFDKGLRGVLAVWPGSKCSGRGCAPLISLGTLLVRGI